MNDDVEVARDWILENAMEKRYRRLSLIALVLIAPVCYWLPSYGMLLLASITAVMLFSASVSIFMLIFASIEKMAMMVVALFRRGWRSAQPHTSIVHHQ